ncbi:MAG TPA: hypothetical protein PL148_02370, partial [Candidatus Aminicenantes bacterium]|nr:hypothetical protein [Candidatus Aminicenantes bacterium]
IALTGKFNQGGFRPFSRGLAAVWLGILYLIKDDVRRLLGEPRGEFVAVIPVGRPAVETPSPAKRPLAAVVRFLE